MFQFQNQRQIIGRAGGGRRVADFLGPPGDAVPQFRQDLPFGLGRIDQIGGQVRYGVIIGFQFLQRRDDVQFPNLNQVGYMDADFLNRSDFRLPAAQVGVFPLSGVPSGVDGFQSRSHSLGGGPLFRVVHFAQFVQLLGCFPQDPGDMSPLGLHRLGQIGITRLPIIPIAAEQRALNGGGVKDRIGQAPGDAAGRQIAGLGGNAAELSGKLPQGGLDGAAVAGGQPGPPGVKVGVESVPIGVDGLVGGGEVCHRLRIHGRRH